MSLDVTLTQLQSTTVYEGNITHNLSAMAQAAGLYEACWMPEELKIGKAYSLIPILQDGLAKLKECPDNFKQFDAKNGWGVYDHFVRFVEEYLAACIQYPSANITVSR